MSTKYMLTCIVVALLALVSASPLLASADADGSDMPGSYDMRDHYDIPDVRNQGHYGTCWAFGETGSIMVTLSKDGEAVQLSPLYMSQMQIDGFRSDLPSEEGDWVAVDEDTNLNDMGGMFMMNLLQVMDWRIVAEEYLAPYTEIQPNNRAESAVDPVYVVKEIRFYDIYDGCSIDSVKSMLMQGYAGQFGYMAYHSDIEFEDGYMLQYLPTYSVANSNHAVLLIGWDDSYPKENFTGEYVPSSDGAWLIQNSWGTDRFNGYGWVSYESALYGVAFCDVAERNDGSLNLYSYDHGVSMDTSYVVNGSSSMANVFVAEGDEELTGASFTSFSDFDSRYKVDAYILSNRSANPADGRIVFSSGWLERDWTGSSYVEFDNPVRLSAGDRFSIVVSFDGDVTSIPLDTSCDYGAVVCGTVADRGESFILVDGAWMDVGADGVTNVRVKAYTSDVSPGPAASCGGNEYGTLQEAVDNAMGDTVVLLRDVSEPTVRIGSDAAIDLNAHTFAPVGGPAFAVDGDASLSLLRGTVASGDFDGVVFDSDGCLSMTHVRFVTDAYSAATTSGTAFLHSVWSDSGLGFRFGGHAELDSCIVGAPVSGGAVIEGGEFSGPLGEGVSVVSGTFSEDPSAFLAEGSVVEPGSAYVVGMAAFVSDEGLVYSDPTNALKNSSYVEMVADCRYEEYILTGGNTAVLDLAGFTLEAASYAYSITVDGDLTIIDSSGGDGLLVCSQPINLKGGSLTIGEDGSPVSAVFEDEVFKFNAYTDVAVLGGSTLLSSDGVCEYFVSSDGWIVGLTVWNDGLLTKSVDCYEVDDGVATVTATWDGGAFTDKEDILYKVDCLESTSVRTVITRDDGSVEIKQTVNIKDGYGEYWVVAIASEDAVEVDGCVAGRHGEREPDQRVYDSMLATVQESIWFMNSYGFDPKVYVVIEDSGSDVALFTPVAVDAAVSLGANLEYLGPETIYAILAEDLSDIQGMGDITVSFRPAGISDLNRMQRASLFGGLAFKLEFEVDGKPVDSLPVKVNAISTTHGSMLSGFATPIVCKADRFGMLTLFAGAVDSPYMGVYSSGSGLYIVMDLPSSIAFLLKVNYVATARTLISNILSSIF